MSKRKATIIVESIILVCFVLFLFSCKDDPSSPTKEDTSFNFKITVKDTAGNPVNGLRVSACGILSIENQLVNKGLALPLKKTNTIQAMTSIGFDVIAPCYAFLSTYNPRNQEVDTLFAGVAQRGMYHVLWALPAGTPSGVYICRFRAENDSIHFQDSIYLVHHSPDPEQNVFGWTSQSGIFEISDALMFPSFIDFPPFTYTNATSPDSLGSFTYTDSVAVVLTDTTSHQQQRYVLKVGKQNNAYNLTWNPPSTLSGYIKQDIPIMLKSNREIPETDPYLNPSACELSQNYPNPFN